MSTAAPERELLKLLDFDIEIPCGVEDAETIHGDGEPATWNGRHVCPGCGMKARWTPTGELCRAWFLAHADGWLGRCHCGAMVRARDSEWVKL